jgi:myo-inositol-1(or 4)-monophosphatase
MIDAREAAAITEFAEDAIALAGEIALRYFRSSVEVINKAKKRAYDPVTQADREVEEFLRERIGARWPAHAVVGEEFGGQRGAAPAWLIDPIDGTKSFISGTPMWGILLGLADGERCVAGLMRQPYLRETWVGSDTGAFLVHDGTRRALQTRDTAAIGDAILCCTHPEMFRSETEAEAFRRVAAASRFTRFGTECYGYCLLASGSADLVVEADLEAYDVMPLVPIVERAGGVISTWDGAPALNGGRIVAAANPALHAAALKLLNS